MERLEKENVLENFKNMIKKAWTYDKMTTQEQNALMDVLNHPNTTTALKGKYHQRWDVLNAIYWGYLKGLGYNGFNWREEEEQPF
jgi:hypothetical protein